MTDVLANIVSGTFQAFYTLLPEKKEVEKVVIKEVRENFTEMGPRNGGMIVRVAGVSGALAVVLGAYGAHVFRPSDVDPERKLVFETANKYHFIHTLALMGVPLTRRPLLVGSLMCSGLVLFSGTCYYHALTGNRTVRKATPYGGILLIAAWLAMIL